MKLLIVFAVFSLIACSMAVSIDKVKNHSPQQETLESCRQFCMRVRCARPANCEDKEKEIPNSKFVLKEKASHCSCCPMCIQILAEGEACVLSHEFGLARLSQCAEGLSCTNGKCDKN